MSRAIGLDVHRDFCVVAICERGRAHVAGRVETSPEQLELFGRSLAATDRVVLEATGSAWAIARVLEPHVAEVVLAHPKRVRAIAEAKIKTDKVDARVLAELLAADYIPRVWIGDELTRMLRRLVARRRGLVKRRTQIKNEIQAVLHRNLTKGPPARLGSVRPRRPHVAGRTGAADRRAPDRRRVPAPAGLSRSGAGGDRSRDRRAGRRRRGRATADDDPGCRCDHRDHAASGDR